MELENVEVKLPDISDVDIGYAAGFYEGEGSFVGDNPKYGSVTITQKDPEPLLKLRALFGGEVRLYSGYHYWRLYGDECKAFIVLIFEHLSNRRKEQILKFKEFFYAVDSCPNNHPYVDGSYKITDDPRGRVYRTCLVCAKENNKRKNAPSNRAILGYASLAGITKEEASEFLNAAKTKKEVN